VIKRLERRQKIMVIAVAMNTILMVAAALVLFYFAYIGRFDYFESARLVIVTVQLSLFIAIMTYSICMIFRTIWAIPELSINRILIFAHLMLFVALSASFILDYVDLYSVIFMINSIAMGALYMLLLYMIH
jgi:hypothetical protein